jgi:import receptor subunit TOM22
MKNSTGPKSVPTKKKNGTLMMVRPPSPFPSLSNHHPESDASSIASSLADETLYDRLSALQDIVPPKQRAILSNTYSTASDWVGRGLTFGGQALWVLSTSVLLVGLPWALAFAEDQQMAEAEQQMKMQQTANEVSFFLAVLK